MPIITSWWAAKEHLGAQINSHIQLRPHVYIHMLSCVCVYIYYVHTHSVSQQHSQKAKRKTNGLLPEQRRQKCISGAALRERVFSRSEKERDREIYCIFKRPVGVCVYLLSEPLTAITIISHHPGQCINGVAGNSFPSVLFSLRQRRPLSLSLVQYLCAPGLFVYPLGC